MRLRQGRRLVLSFGVLAMIAIAASCREPTQITLRITSGEKCTDLTGVQIIVAPNEDVARTRFTQHFAAAVTHACTADGTNNLIGTLVVTPGESTGTVIVSAGVSQSINGMTVAGPEPATCADSAAIASHCIIARRSFSFIDHSSLTLPINLDPLCVGKVCDDPGSTCYQGSCVKDAVSCDSSTCLLPQEVGSGSGTDGSSSDGAYDQDGANLGDAMTSMDDGSLDMDSGSSVNGDADADTGVVAMVDGGDAGNFVTPFCSMDTSCFPAQYGRYVPGHDCKNTVAGAQYGCCFCTCKSNNGVTSCDLMQNGTSCGVNPMCP